tara:strand:- start:1341 stop:1727 length:387 start_codon:yes stop_codon:yes gene_type:complete
MKKIILILSLFPLLTFSQSNNTYKEINIGIALFDDGGFPGASFLFGKTNYFSNNTLLDYQLGVAFPSIVTGKIGFGIGNEDFATIIGFRPWPTCPYLQISFKERHNLSVEHGVYADYVVTLLTYGIRF